ncbi:MAG: cation:dicarboxylase symporter family transporter, partial [Thermoguttaceae bacterium]|nr:cation:dicarboxylase symporter family transporter [Thermoguttaceae bacterium]
MRGSFWKKAFGWYFRCSLLARILVGLIAGAVTGIAVGPAVEVIQPLGTVFIRMLQMIVVPLIVATLVVGAAGISPARLGRVGLKTVAFFMLTTACAVAIGLAAANTLRPGAGLELGNEVG